MAADAISRLGLQFAESSALFEKAPPSQDAIRGCCLAIAASLHDLDLSAVVAEGSPARKSRTRLPEDTAQLCLDCRLPFYVTKLLRWTLPAALPTKPWHVSPLEWDVWQQGVALLRTLCGWCPTEAHDQGWFTQLEHAGAAVDFSGYRLCFGSNAPSLSVRLYRDEVKVL